MAIMMQHTVGLHRERGRRFAPMTEEMVQVDTLSIMISNLGTVARHFFFEKVTCNDRHILKSNEVKVSKRRKSDFVASKSTLALEYFVISKK